MNDPVNLIDPLGLQCNPAQNIGGCGEIVVTGGGGEHEPAAIFPFQIFAFGTPMMIGPTLAGFDFSAPQFLNPTAPAKACKAPLVSDAERRALARRDVTAFWKSRLARGDPFAATALSVVQNRGAYGAIANGMLAGSIRNVYGGLPTASIQQMMGQISLSIAQAHAATVTQFHGTTPGAIARYHYDVFASYHLPQVTFAGGRNQAFAIASNAVLNWAGCQ